MNRKLTTKPQYCKQAGQTLVEFILLFLVTMGISYAFLSTVNSNIADIWKNTFEAIVSPTPDKIEFR